MVKDCIKMVATFLSLDDVLAELQIAETQGNAYVLNTDSYSYNTLSAVQKKIYDIIQFIGLTLNEIASEYIAFETEENLSSTATCEIPLSSFSKAFRDIYDVVDRTSLCSVTFNLYPEFIKVATPYRSYRIRYCYYPESPDKLSDTITLPSCVSLRILAYKVASEFCIKNCLFDDATMWDKRFIASILQVKQKVRGYRILERPLY